MNRYCYDCWKISSLVAPKTIGPRPSRMWSTPQSPNDSAYVECWRCRAINRHCDFGRPSLPADPFGPYRMEGKSDWKESAIYVVPKSAKPVKKQVLFNI